MGSIKKILQLFVIFLIFQNAENKRKYRAIHFLGHKHVLNPKYVKYMHVEFSQNNTAVSALFETQDIITDMWGTAGVAYWQKQSRTFRPILSYDFDLCEILRLRLRLAKMALLKTWISNLLKYSNLSADCPFAKPAYYVTNLKVDKSSISEFAPSGKFRTSLILFRKQAKYCNETAELFVNVYGWYYMHPTVHKVLILGADIIEHIGIPIGTLSEEAQEASNKIFKAARHNNSRAFSRKLNNEDVFHYLVISSDPLISTIRIKTENNKQVMMEEAFDLVIEL